MISSVDEHLESEGQRKFGMSLEKVFQVADRPALP
jgi:hypothetical protein